MIVSNPYLDMRKIADSGQIFRFNKVSATEYELLAQNKFLHIKEKSLLEKDGISYSEYEFDCSRKEFEAFWKEYFDLNTDYEKFSKDIPEDDAFLTKAASYGRGVRILKQDSWEMLMSFIISQRKSIPAIKSSIEKLSKMFGEKIDGERFAFPSANALADASMKELEACSLGYRAPYIKESAKAVAEGDCDLKALCTLDDTELLKALMSLKGVGIKVANCVALFGYYRIDSFPVDVWIKKICDKYYEGSFPVEKYKGYAGVIQQYMFFYGREGDKES